MAQQTQMPANDLDSILESELGTPEPAAQPNSEGPTAGSEEPPTPPAPGGNGESVEGVTPEGKPAAAPETAPSEPQGGQNRRPYSRLEKAEFSATKWKRRARKLAEEKTKLQEEFDRYKDLNPAAFRNPEERMQFMAWKASAAQRLNDMNQDLDDIAQAETEDAYEEKISNCYSRPESVEGYRQLDDHYSKAFEYMCRRVDPDGIIMDYLKDSPYEPAMRNVIYKNGDLQEELFREYRNPTIGNAKRQQILQRLEANVAAYYSRQSKPSQPAAQPAQPANGTEPVKPAKEGAERKPRFQLPPRKEVPPAKETRNQAPAPQVTGTLTRGNAGGSEPDTSAQADGLFKQLFGAGA